MAKKYAPGCKTAKRKATRVCDNARKVSTCRTAVIRAVNKCAPKGKRSRRRKKGKRRTPALPGWARIGATGRYVS